MMKVWELIAELSKCPAGWDVLACRGNDTHIFNVDYAEKDDNGEFFKIVGDNSKPDADDNIEL